MMERGRKRQHSRQTSVSSSRQIKKKQQQQRVDVEEKVQLRELVSAFIIDHFYRQQLGDAEEFDGICTGILFRKKSMGPNKDTLCIADSTPLDRNDWNLHSLNSLQEASRRILVGYYCVVDGGRESQTAQNLQPITETIEKACKKFLASSLPKSQRVQPICLSLYITSHHGNNRKFVHEVDCTRAGQSLEVELVDLIRQLEPRYALLKSMLATAPIGAGWWEQCTAYRQLNGELPNSSYRRTSFLRWEECQPKVMTERDYTIAVCAGEIVELGEIPDEENYPSDDEESSGENAEWEGEGEEDDGREGEGEGEEDDGREGEEDDGREGEEDDGREGEEDDGREGEEDDGREGEEDDGSRNEDESGDESSDWDESGDESNVREGSGDEEDASMHSAESGEGEREGSGDEEDASMHSAESGEDDRLEYFKERMRDNNHKEEEELEAIETCLAKVQGATTERKAEKLLKKALGSVSSSRERWRLLMELAPIMERRDVPDLAYSYYAQALHLHPELAEEHGFQERLDGLAAQVDEMDNIELLRLYEVKKELDMIPRSNIGLKRALTASYYHHAHETTAIEGNTYTYEECYRYLKNRKIAAGKIRGETDVKELDGMEKSFKLFMQMKLRLGRLSDKKILKIHKAITEASKPTIAGKLRRIQVMFGPFTPSPSPRDVPRALRDLLTTMNSKTFRDSIDAVEQMAMAHLLLVALHPFADGNGRTSRMVMTYLFSNMGLPPPLIKAHKGDRGKGYLKGLDAAFNGDIRKFLRYIAQESIESVEYFLKRAKKLPDPGSGAVFSSSGSTVGQRGRHSN